MSERLISVCGYPGSGKTTFLAALWHLVTARDLETVLRFDSLRDGDVSYLNAIANKWRQGWRQVRTPLTTEQLVSMNLIQADGATLRLTFPDTSGEAFQRAWEERDCDPRLVDKLRGEGVLLFVHADEIKAPRWVVDDAALSRDLNLAPPSGEPVSWEPRLAPTQVKVVSLLQSLRRDPFDVGPRRVAVIFSAWDTVAAEGLGPRSFLAEKLPLLDQYLRNSPDGWSSRAYGISAQGGEFEKFDPDRPKTPRGDDVRTLLAQSPTERIQVVSEDATTHDLTEPTAWVLG